MKKKRHTNIRFFVKVPFSASGNALFGSSDKCTCCCCSTSVNHKSLDFIYHEALAKCFIMHNTVYPYLCHKKSIKYVFLAPYVGPYKRKRIIPMKDEIPYSTWLCVLEAIKNCSRCYAEILSWLTLSYNFQFNRIYLHYMTVFFPSMM